MDEPVSKFIYRFDDLQLWILPAGSAPEDPVNILQSSRFLELYKQLSTCFDWIIIDAPPLLPMADVSFWSRQADGLLLVVREGTTPKTILQKGLETLDNPKVIGVVLNDAQQVESSLLRPLLLQGTQAFRRKQVVAVHTRRSSILIRTDIHSAPSHQKSKPHAQGHNAPTGISLYSHLRFQPLHADDGGVVYAQPQPGAEAHRTFA